MKNMATEILHTTKHTLKYAFEKSRLKCTSNTIKKTLHCYKQSKNLNSLTCRRFSRFWNPAIFCLLPYLPVVRPTRARCKGPVFSHKKGDCCINTNPLYWRTFIHSAIACPLVIHSIDWSCLKQRCQNLTYHKHSMEGINM